MYSITIYRERVRFLSSFSCSQYGPRIIRNGMFLLCFARIFSSGKSMFLLYTQMRKKYIVLQFMAEVQYLLTHSKPYDNKLSSSRSHKNYDYNYTIGNENSAVLLAKINRSQSFWSHTKPATAKFPH